MIRQVWKPWREDLPSDEGCGWSLRNVIVVLIVTMCMPTLVLAQNPILAQPSPQERRRLARLIDQVLPQFDIDPQRLPGRFRRQVIKRVYDYAVLYHADMEVMLKRAAAFLPMIKRTFEQHNVPVYFAYMPLVESRFRVDATHPQSGARGLWQLMPSTARGYGLQVSSQVDERLDPRRATLAAARYLQGLQERFGLENPLSILAAYNYGDTNLARAMRHARTRDILHLYTYRRLPYQTRDYLIKMVAFWVVVSHVAHFKLVPTGPQFLPVITDLAPLYPFSLVAMGQPAAIRHDSRVE
jgi:hypothetical protein